MRLRQKPGTWASDPGRDGERLGGLPRRPLLANSGQRYALLMLTGKRRRFAVGTAERRLPPVNPALSAASRFPPSSECDGPTLGLTDRRVSNCAAADYSRRNGGCGIHSAVADTLHS